MDQNYNIICIGQNKFIELYYFNFNTCYDTEIILYPVCFSAANTYLLFNLISLYNKFNIISTNHKLYLGKELFKAEVAIKINQIYIQD
uniref:DUF4346 domain-containing protein n=1 Tax=Sonderella linearis TaxID=110477 RepID=A0A1Z1MML4_9FLOR|nr:hypothetical protein [Sonderella linearis]ARW67001.1 hypothetical protein [Sonderella linearis]